MTVGENVLQKSTGTAFTVKPWQIAPEDIPSPLNVFQTMKTNGKAGAMRYVMERPRPGTSRRVLKNPLFRLLKKISEARRAKNRRAQAYLAGTSERGDGAQRSI